MSAEVLNISNLTVPDPYLSFKQLKLSDGDLVAGKVIQASAAGVKLNIGGATIQAKLEGTAPSAGWWLFQVNVTEADQISLKIISAMPANTPADSGEAPPPIPNIAFDPQLLTDEGVPLTKENILKYFAIMQQFQAKYNMLPNPKAAALLIARDWPDTPGTILAAWLAQDQKLREQLWNVISDDSLLKMVVSMNDSQETILTNLLKSAQEAFPPEDGESAVPGRPAQPSVPANGSPAEPPAASAQPTLSSAATPAPKAAPNPTLLWQPLLKPEQVAFTEEESARGIRSSNPNGETPPQGLVANLSEVKEDLPLDRGTDWMPVIKNLAKIFGQPETEETLSAARDPLWTPDSQHRISASETGSQTLPGAPLSPAARQILGSLALTSAATQSGETVLPGIPNDKLTTILIQLLTHELPNRFPDPETGPAIASYGQPLPESAAPTPASAELPGTVPLQPKETAPLGLTSGDKWIADLMQSIKHGSPNIALDPQTGPTAANSGGESTRESLAQMFTALQKALASSTGDPPLQGFRADSKLAIDFIQLLKQGPSNILPDPEPGVVTMSAEGPASDRMLEIATVLRGLLAPSAEKTSLFATDVDNQQDIVLTQFIKQLKHDSQPIGTETDPALNAAKELPPESMAQIISALADPMALPAGKPLLTELARKSLLATILVQLIKHNQPSMPDETQPQPFLSRMSSTDPDSIPDQSSENGATSAAPTHLSKVQTKQMAAEIADLVRPKAASDPVIWSSTNAHKNAAPSETEREQLKYLLQQNSAVLKKLAAPVETNNPVNIVPMLVTDSRQNIYELNVTWEEARRGDPAVGESEERIRVVIPTENMGEIGLNLLMNRDKIQIHFEVGSTAIRRLLIRHLNLLRQTIQEREKLGIAVTVRQVPLDHSGNGVDLRL